MRCEWCNEALASIKLTITAESLAGGSRASVEHKVCEPCTENNELHMGADGLVSNLRSNV